MPNQTEREKMVAGEIYNGFDPDLEAERLHTQQLLWLHNTTQSLSDRQAILHQLFGHFGQKSIIEPPFYCSYGQNIHIADFVFLNFSCTIFANNRVTIAQHVMIGPFVQIYTASHPLKAQERNQGLEFARPIVIEENVWIGGAAILLPGITVGRNAVIGAGAVVTRDVPSSTIVVGNPARVIRQIES